MIKKTSRTELYLSQWMTLIAGILVAMMIYLPLAGKVTTPSRAMTFVESTGEVLSNHDKELYRQILASEKSLDWVGSNSLISQLNESSLVGSILAERYLDQHYRTNFDEIAAWMSINIDHPAARDLARLAAHKFPTRAAELPQLEEPREEARKHSPELKQSILRQSASGLWNKGLRSYANKQYGQAAESFLRLLSRDLPAVDASAVSFWAWRSLDAADDSRAFTYLERASEFPRTFYGMLARETMGNALPFPASARLYNYERDQLLRIPVTRRALAWKELGETDRAESDIKNAFETADDDTRHRLLKLVSGWNNPALQMAMTYAEGGEDMEVMALYPMPGWKPRSGYEIDPALLYAIVRQESRFDTDARSSRGAQGVMQIMPATARFVVRAQDLESNGNWGRLNDPVTSITLGQEYLLHLMKQPYISSNLIYLTASYNAGPGSVMNWQRQQKSNDPLLFMERIPNEETRNYVQQVLANYWVYSTLLGSNTSSLTDLAQQEWPQYEAANLAFLGLASAE